MELNKHQIVRLIIKNQVLVRKWQQFVGELKFNPIEMVEWEYGFNRNMTPYELFTKILDAWESALGNDGTLDILVSALNKIGTPFHYEVSGNFITALPLLGEASNAPKLTSWGIFYGVFPSVLNFKGRDQEISNLTQTFKGPIKYALVYGLGGIGKTELVKKFAHKNSEHNHVTWLNGDTPARLISSIHDLAEHLEIQIVNEGDNELRLLEQIAARLSNKKWLMIIDDVDEIHEKFKSVIKFTVKINNIFVIVTSQSRSVLDNNSEFIPIDHLLPGDAFQLVNDSLNVKSPPGEIEKLCETLQHFPLALQQAIAYIIDRQKYSVIGCEYGIREYLTDFECQKMKVLEFPPGLTNEYEKTILVNWNLTIQRLKKCSELDIQQTMNVLNILAFLSPDQLTSDFLFQIHSFPFESFVRRLFTRLFRLGNNLPEEKRKNFTKTIETLKTFSIIKIENNYISVHRLVQELIRFNLDENSKTKVLDTIITNLDVKAVQKTEVQHILSVWKHIQKQTELFIKHKSFVDDIYNRLNELSLYFESLNFAKHNFQLLKEKLGEDDQYTLVMESCIPTSTMHTGRYEKALKQFQVILPKMQRILGQEHAATLVTANNMALTLSALERYSEAPEIYYENLEVDMKKFGKDHNETITTKHNIAAALDEQGKYLDSMQLYQEVLERQKNKLGPNHLSTLLTRHNIAACLFRQSKYEEALIEFENILELRVKCLGEEHADTLITKSWLALTLRELGQEERALKMFDEILRLRISTLDNLQKPNTDPDNYAYTPPSIRRELPQPGSTYCNKVLSSFVPLCAPVFVGREDILIKIERRFETVLKYETYTPYRKASFIVIYGLPGMGKSEVALHYLHTILSKQTAHCIWLEADTDESFLKSLESALLKFSINSPFKKGNADFLAIITNLFESVKDFPFVFCVDNLDNLYFDNAKISKADSFVCALLTQSKSFPDARVQLIITTRRHLRDSLLYEPIYFKVNELTTENSIELLYRSVSCKLSLNFLRKVNSSLLNYPLLVKNATVFLNKNISTLESLSQEKEFEKELITEVTKISKFAIISIFETFFKKISTEVIGKKAIDALFTLNDIRFSDRFVIYPAILLYISKIGLQTTEKFFDLNSQSIEDFLIPEIQWLEDFSICYVTQKPFSKFKNLKFIQINTVIEFILNKWDFHAFASKDLETQINECKTLIQSVNLKSQLPLTSQIAQNYCFSGYTVQNINFVLDNLAPIFTGRNSEVAQIEDFLKNENDNVVVVYGSQGIGKTELIKFIFNNSNDFLFKFWLDISTKNMHCITKFYYDKIFLVFNDIFNNFEDVLEVAGQYSVLLVIDHAPHFNDTDQLTQLLDIYQRIPNLRLVYITRQNPNLMMGFHIQLEALTESDSKSLITKAIAPNSKNSTKSVLSLCAQTQNHPLVLTEALKTVNNQKFGGNIEKYLETHELELQNLRLKKDQVEVVLPSGVTDSESVTSNHFALIQKIIHMLSYFDPSALVDIDFIAAVLTTELQYQTISNEEVLQEMKFVSKFLSLCTINELGTQIRLNEKVQIDYRTDMSVLPNFSELTVLKTLISSFKILLQSPSFKPINMFHVVNVWNHLCCYDEKTVSEVNIFESIQEAAVKLKCTLKVVHEKTHHLKVIDCPS